ncbi:MAG: hypothetical protein GX879_05455, partial [Bacteroidales bacterium]|nr:hypothetical protein [Bacteroidales bacterium]
MRYESLVKLVTSIVIISLSVSYTYAQKLVISDTLSWKNVISIENDENKVENILSFENYFQNNDNFLPVYRKKIEIPEQHSIKNLKIVNQKFEKITEIDSNLLTDVDKILNQLDINYGVSVFRKQYYAVIEFVPLVKNNFDGNVEKLVEFEIQLELESENLLKTTAAFVQNSKLNAGKWYKIKLEEKG